MILSIRSIVSRTAMLLIGCCALAAPLYLLYAHRVITDTHHPHDFHSVNEKRFALIRGALPPNATVGYLNSNSIPFVDDTDLIASAYYLTPAILIKITNVNSIPYEYVLLESISPVKFNSNGFARIASTNGLSLYRRSGAMR